MKEKILRKLIERLSEENVGEYISLPQIVVMGDTSSGKSSLLSAISNVSFPANDQLTTRCPTRLKMERTSQSSIEVSISWHWTSSKRINWPKRRPKKKDLVKVIQEAQECILKTSGREVARDIVEIAICQPDLYDLTIIDLPGIVRSVGEGEDSSIIGEIDTIIQEYLENERCVIVCVHPACVDFHNASILADAKKVDPNTRRTLPVLTKPDLIDPGAEGAAVELLCNQKMHFYQGFHLVKGRGQASLNAGKSIQEGVKEETHFFETVSPWKGIRDRSLFGTEALKEKLAEIQIQIIESSMVGIKEEIKEKKKIAQDRLAALGPILDTPSSKRMYFGELIEELYRSLDAELNGKQGSTGNKEGYLWRAELSQFYAEFSTDILGLPFAHLEPVEKILEKNKEVDLLKEGKSVGNVKIENIRQEKSNGDIVVQFFDKEKNERGEVSSYQLCHKLTANHRLWVADMMEKKQGKNFPCMISGEFLSSTFAITFKEQAIPVIQRLVNKVTAHFLALVEKIFDVKIPKEHNLMKSLLLDDLHKLMDQLIRDSEAQIDFLIETEMDPSTQNKDLFQEIMKRRDGLLQEQILFCIHNSADAKELPGMVMQLFSFRQQQNLEEFLLHDVVILLSAYGFIAAKRIIDYVPTFLEHRLLKPLLPLVRKFLAKSDSEVSLLLREDCGLIAERKKVMEELAVMEKAERTFMEILLLPERG